MGGGLTNVGGTLYFFWRAILAAIKLWRSDGTADGTMPVASLPPADQYPTSLIGVSGRLFFVATDSAHGRELWTSDGTAAGAKMVKDILIGVPPYNTNSNPFGLSAVGGTLFFMAWGGNDYELWKSNGTTSGTCGSRRSGSATASRFGSRTISGRPAADYSLPPACTWMAVVSYGSATALRPAPGR